MARSHAWQRSPWEGYAGVLTAAYLAAGSVHGELAPLPHDLRLLEASIDLRVDAGCQGNGREGFCFLRATADLLGLGAWDMHSTADTILAQLPVSVELHLHDKLVGGWSGCFDLFGFEVHLPETLVALDAEYAFATPAFAGQPATRATDNDLWQALYDALGRFHAPKPRE